MTIDYGQTIHLPKTDFPRRAGLAQKEPEILKRWEKMGLYDLQRKQSAGKEKFILHMGPPFANGHIHIGHVLTTVLKDVVCRSYQSLGYDAPLVPGFDCHGLPIEWKIEEKYRKASSNVKKEDIGALKFREECRAFADHWVGVQSSEFIRLGIHGDFKNPYLTMNKRSEALIAQEIHKFLLNGALYRGSKPVMWSVPEQTALAEAEVEYRDHTSDTVWVKFPVWESPKHMLMGWNIVIWTTTPWTLPGNRAIAFGDALNYVALTVEKVNEGSIAKVGDKLIVLEDLYANFLKDASIAEAKVVRKLTGEEFVGTVCKHPLNGKGYDFKVKMLAGDFVTTDTGTGFVHVAPGHGEDDFRLGSRHAIEVPHTVSGDGKYLEHVPQFAGLAVYYADGKKGPANKVVTQAIMDAGNLVAKGQVQHSYPHSWRSKAPVIFRNTPQWFISMDKTDLRKTALGEIKKTRWLPARGENRIAAMVEQRGDWGVSRQRYWGVPIAVFVSKKTHEPLKDKAVLDKIFAIFEKEGSDAWFTHPPQDFLGPQYQADDYEQIMDIIDVWFESGSTQGFVLEQRSDLKRPADLYLEGSDQHRGWFQSSLLVGCGTRGNAPFKAVLTHGFILDEKGYKMSKSGDNAMSPTALMNEYGADILRLWTAGSDYTEDTKFGKNILQGHVDVYRRIRNTFCYLLGSLGGFSESQRVAYKDLGDFDKWVLHRLHAIDKEVRQCILDFDFLTLSTIVHNFCARDLSAFYFDVCKDTLYCEAIDSVKRRAVVTVLDHVFNHLVHWLSPVLCFTAEEAWLSYKGLGMDDLKESIHLSTMPAAPAEWHAPELAERWAKIAAARSVVTGALEIKRAEKQIGASLEAAPTVHVADTALASVLKSISFEEVCITSGIRIEAGKVPDGAFTLTGVDNVAVTFGKAEGTKCERCWRYTTDVGKSTQHPGACARCAEVLKKEA
ncbi:MAG: isoleucine--tRNA ligase [Alphaproteobacteria bacterium]